MKRNVGSSGLAYPAGTCARSLVPRSANNQLGESGQTPRAGGLEMDPSVRTGAQVGNNE